MPCGPATAASSPAGCCSPTPTPASARRRWRGRSPPPPAGAWTPSRSPGCRRRAAWRRTCWCRASSPYSTRCSATGRTRRQEAVRRSRTASSCWCVAPPGRAAAASRRYGTRPSTTWRWRRSCGVTATAPASSALRTCCRYACTRASVKRPAAGGATSAACSGRARASPWRRSPAWRRRRSRWPPPSRPEASSPRRCCGVRGRPPPPCCGPGAGTGRRMPCSTRWTPCCSPGCWRRAFATTGAGGCSAGRAGRCGCEAVLVPAALPGRFLHRHRQCLHPRAAQRDRELVPQHARQQLDRGVDQRQQQGVGRREDIAAVAEAGFDGLAAAGAEQPVAGGGQQGPRVEAAAERAQHALALLEIHQQPRVVELASRELHLHLVVVAVQQLGAAAVPESEVSGRELEVLLGEHDAIAGQGGHGRILQASPEPLVWSAMPMTGIRRWMRGRGGGEERAGQAARPPLPALAAAMALVVLLLLAALAVSGRIVVPAADVPARAGF